MSLFTDIVLPTAVHQSFTYSVPPALEGKALMGKRAWVPLQKHKAIGFVVKVHDDEPDFTTRPILQVLDPEPVLSDELLELTRWISRFYYCGWGEVMQAALPAGLNFQSEKYLKLADETLPLQIEDTVQKIISEVQDQGRYPLKEAERRWDAGIIKKLIGRKVLEVWEDPPRMMEPKMVKMWDWTTKMTKEEVQSFISQHKENDKYYKWIQALEKLAAFKLPEFQSELTQHELLESYTLNRIAEEGLIRAEEVEASDLSIKHTHDPSRLSTLNQEQQVAYDEIEAELKEQQYKSFLLYGVTGSGKTEVYIHSLKKALEMGKGGLVLVPEIGLTPQIVKRFYTIFGDDIAVLHSRLTKRERFDAWRALQKGEKRIAIGARSAVFAPVKNLGLLIVDEEHDASYKQVDPAPRYHGRDVAIMRAHINDAVVVIGSATPSMVSLYGARQGKSKMLSLTNRPFEAKMPHVNVLDLKQYRSAMRGPLAVPLFSAIEEALKNGEQAILLYNRRGYSYFLQCEHCGEIPECPNCSVSLTYHKSKKQLRCHYCGYSQRQPKNCAECRHAAIAPHGSGTQQLEEQIKDLFPEGETLRMDYDTTSGKHAHANILRAFGRKEADILVGTQIVGKGLDFPEVTVVGVIDADTELAFPSFRSGERMFQLLSQVAGRSGRSEKEGKVFFQTWQPEHIAIKTAKNHEYKEFARQELASRKMLQYPPFSRIIRFTFKGKREQRVYKVAQAFTDTLIEVLGTFDSVLGPSPAAISRMQNDYRWESFIKVRPSNSASAIEKVLDKTFNKYNQSKPDGASSVRINVNVDALE